MICHGISVYPAFYFQAMLGKKNAMISGKCFSIIISELWDSRSHSVPLILGNYSVWQDLLSLGFYPLGFFWILCGHFHFLLYFSIVYFNQFQRAYLGWFCSNKELFGWRFSNIRVSLCWKVVTILQPLPVASGWIWTKGSKEMKPQGKFHACSSLGRVALWVCSLCGHKGLCT